MKPIDVLLDLRSFGLVNVIDVAGLLIVRQQVAGLDWPEVHRQLHLTATSANMVMDRLREAKLLAVDGTRFVLTDLGRECCAFWESCGATAKHSPAPVSLPEPIEMPAEAEPERCHAWDGRRW